LLRASRLVTLTGTGGIGKTRLALRVAAEAAAIFADGVSFVDLAPLSDHTLVAKAIAGAIGIVESN
jgi:predicted ATPase